MDRRFVFAAFLVAALVASALPGLLAAGDDVRDIRADSDLAYAAAVGGTSLAPLGAADKATYIVVGTAPPLAAYRGGVVGLAPTDPAVTGAGRLDAGSAASRAYLDHLSQQQTNLIGGIEVVLGRQVNVLFRYQATLNGFAVQLTQSEANWVASLPGVERVVRDEVRYLLTDNGPRWLGAPVVWGEDPVSGACVGNCGEGVVVGVIDTGVNTDHPSFADPGPVDGYNYPAYGLPSGPGYKGLCDPVTGLPSCNDKLIGVYDFTPNPPFTGEDINGHGSHTASTAAGNILDVTLNAPTITLNRRISGVAPHANIISYRACQTLIPQVGCLLSGLLAAINQATLDEVDVINYSIGGGSADPWTDADAVAFLNARRAGIFVSASAGNSGPGPRTIGSPADAPWVLTVGASTHNRKLANVLVDMFGGPGSPPADMEGKSLTSGYPAAPDRRAIVYAGDFAALSTDPPNAALCGAGTANPATGEGTMRPWPQGFFSGQIVVCDRGVYGRVHKGQNLQFAGAGGYILANDAASGNSLVGDPHVLPAVHITFSDGQILKTWLASGTGGMGRIRGTIPDETAANGDVMASFSSRGANPAVPDLLKPDVTAPGVDILAAFNNEAGPPPQFGIISGTSMSSPHAAGSAALIRGLHPTWSPDEVKSAMMTTAFAILPGTGAEAHDVLKENGVTPADPFDMGAGRVDLRLAGRAGLVLDVNPAAYGGLNAPPADVKAINLPSMADDDCKGTCSWTRTVKSTASVPVTWSASTSGPTGLTLTAAPSTFTLAPGATQTITVTANVNAVTPGQWHFGQVKLVSSVTSVPNAHLPVAVFASGGVASPRLALHFHGNAGLTGGDHDSGLPGEACSTGDGRSDLTLCEGPWLLKSGTLSPSPPASWKGGPMDWALDGTIDRIEVDASWVWCLRQGDPPGDPTGGIQCPEVETPPQGSVTVEGPMTVEWWAQCGALCVFGTDWDVEVWADGVRKLQQRVEAGAAGVTSFLTTTVNLPRFTANHRIVVEIEPVFLADQAVEFAIFYDSRDPCAATSAGPCDSRVLVPVEGLVPLNHAPIAADDSGSVSRGGSTTINVLGNDVDPDDDTLTITSVSNPSHGTVTREADMKSLTYRHNGDGATADSFTYTIDDGRGGSDTATVSIAIAQTARLTLAPKTASNTVGTQHCVTATLADTFGGVPGVTVRFSVPTSGATHANPASGASVTDASGQATFCYRASLPGLDAIHAFADSDDDFAQDTTEPFDDAAKTWTLPASTALCEVKITQGGWFVADNGDRANFGGNAKVSASGSTVTGQETYQDQGPARAMKVKSTQLTATTCSGDHTTATIFGRATIDGSGDFVFRIDVTDMGEPGTSDSYGIMLSNGYASGQHQLRGGNVQIH